MHDGISMITKEMIIGEVVEKYPGASGLMANFGLHCFGCHANPYETIEDGVISHGFSETELNTLLIELNTLAEQSKKNTINQEHSQEKIVSLTENAAAEVKNMLKMQGREGFGLTINVKSGGCAGFMYEINFAKEPSARDIVVEDQGLKLFVDPEAVEFVRGAQVEYVAGLMNAGFKVVNPNEKKACGCGSSIGF